MMLDAKAKVGHRSGMANTRRPVAFWFIIGFLALSVVVLLLGQTVAVFDYELAMRLGLQESPEQVGAYGMQVNRAFGAGDTVVYIPLMLSSLVGLWFRKRCSLPITAAVAGISVYWTTTIGIWLFVGGYMLIRGLKWKSWDSFRLLWSLQHFYALS